MTDYVAIFDKYWEESAADDDFDGALDAVVRVAKAEAWDEGALYAAVECNAIDDEKNQWLAPGDNPYRKETK